MQYLISGQNIVINNKQLIVTFQYITSSNWQNSTLDPSIFLLAKNEKIRNDDDFIFYNQPKSVDGSIELQCETDLPKAKLDLEQLDNAIEKIALTIVIDGPDTFASLTNLTITVANLFTFDIPLNEKTEKALIIGQFYRHNGDWKFRALGQGFNGGLGPLAIGYGVEISDQQSADSDISQPSDSSELESIITEEEFDNLNLDIDEDMEDDSLDNKLEEKITKDAPHLSFLVQSAKDKIKKYKLGRLKAKMVFVFDASGSMLYQFSRGNVQAVLDRMMVLSAQFDSSEAVDVWGFASKHLKYEDAILSSSKDYIKNLQKSVPKEVLGSVFKGILPELGVNNNEPPVMMEVVQTFKNSKIPVIITFITDGGIYEDKNIQAILKESANYPIFWKFIGLGGRNYGILDALNSLTDRKVNNTDFFPINNFESISNEEFYEQSLTNIKEWIYQVKKMRII